MICVDFDGDASAGFQMENDQAAMTSKSFSFNIDRCNPKNRAGKKPCKSKEEIDKFIFDVQLDIFQYYEKIDFLKFNEKPVFKMFEIVSTSVLKADTVLNLQV